MPTHTHIHSLITPCFHLFPPVSLHLPSPPNHQAAHENICSKINIKSSTASNVCERLKKEKVGWSKEKGFKRSFELWERTAVSDVSRKVVSDKGNLNGERPVTYAFKLSSCTRKKFFICTGMENVFIWTGVENFFIWTGMERVLWL